MKSPKLTIINPNSFAIDAIVDFPAPGIPVIQTINLLVILFIHRHDILYSIMFSFDHDI